MELEMEGWKEAVDAPFGGSCRNMWGARSEEGVVIRVGWWGIRGMLRG